jgi:hypothetical protein
MAGSRDFQQFLPTLSRQHGITHPLQAVEIANRNDGGFGSDPAPLESTYLQAWDVYPAMLKELIEGPGETA